VQSSAAARQQNPHAERLDLDHVIVRGPTLAQFRQKVFRGRFRLRQLTVAMLSVPAGGGRLWWNCVSATNVCASSNENRPASVREQSANTRSTTAGQRRLGLARPPSRGPRSAGGLRSTVARHGSRKISRAWWGAADRVCDSMILFKMAHPARSQRAGAAKAAVFCPLRHFAEAGREMEGVAPGSNRPAFDPHAAGHKLYPGGVCGQWPGQGPLPPYWRVVEEGGLGQKKRAGRKNRMGELSGGGGLTRWAACR